MCMHCRFYDVVTQCTKCNMKQQWLLIWIRVDVIPRDPNRAGNKAKGSSELYCFPCSVSAAIFRLSMNTPCTFHHVQQYASYTDVIGYNLTARHAGGCVHPIKCSLFAILIVFFPYSICPVNSFTWILHTIIHTICTYNTIGAGDNGVLMDDKNNLFHIFDGSCFNPGV